MRELAPTQQELGGLLRVLGICRQVVEVTSEGIIPDLPSGSCRTTAVNDNTARGLRPACRALRACAFVGPIGVEESVVEQLKMSWRNVLSM